MVKTKGITGHEERNLLSVAVKNIVGPHRSSLRVISSLCETNKDPAKTAILSQSKDEIAKDLTGICDDVRVS